MPTVNVDSTQTSWTDSGITLSNGQGLRIISVTGSVQFAGGFYTFPEGAYSPYNDPNHAEQPGSVNIDFSSEATNGPFITHQVPNYALVLKVSNTTPGSSGVTGTLRPNRSATFYSDQLGSGKVWFIFNDNAYIDNSGSWTITYEILPPPGTSAGGGAGTGAITGFKYVWRKRLARPVPHCIGVLVGKSTQIFAGNPLVLTIGSTYTGAGSSQVPVVRPLTVNDHVTASTGLIGVALFDLQTDANGRVVRNTGPVSVSGSGRLLDRGFTNDLPLDPLTGFIRIPIASFDDDNIFEVWTDKNQVANYYDVGRAVGIGVTDQMLFPINLQPPSESACLMIEDVETEDSRFNDPTGGGAVYVRCLPSFYSRNIANGFFTT